ncbi:MAG: CGNR zinc finger domain-containing protein [Cyanobacteria bacterium]|nr:CGNR zinc finger domain-containing protein [Cyanobacteriota bacterium]
MSLPQQANHPPTQLEPGTLDDFYPQLLYIGGHRAMDFLNTSFVFFNRPFDLLKNFSDLLRWLVGAGLLKEEEKTQLLSLYDNSPQADALLLQVKHLRTLLQQFVLGVDLDNTKRSQILQDMNHFLQGFAFTNKLSWNAENTVEHHSSSVMPQPLSLVQPFIEISIDFLLHANLKYVQKCENEPCALYFIDISKNKSRRWCSMDHCGNKTKVNKFRQKQKAQL